MTLEMQKLARSILNLADHARQEVEVYTVSQKALQVEVSDGQVETLREAQQTGVGIRVIDSGRLGLAFTTRLDTESLKDVITLAGANAQSATADEYNILPSPRPTKPMNILDPSMAGACGHQDRLGRNVEVCSEHMITSGQSKAGSLWRCDL